MQVLQLLQTLKVICPWWQDIFCYSTVIQNTTI